MTAGELARLPNPALASLMASGRAFAPAEVAGSVYRGVSLGLPAWVERLTWKKFAKAFARDADRIHGWNVKIDQDGLDRPWRITRRRGVPRTFGPFAVVETAEGVVLDYDVPGGLLRALRDPVVALDDTGDLLLGRSLLAIGSRRIATPSYFTLERDPSIQLADVVRRA